MELTTVKWLKRAEKILAGLPDTVNIERDEKRLTVYIVSANSALRAVTQALRKLAEDVPKGEECPNCQRYVRMPYDTPHPTHTLVEQEGSTIYGSRFATRTKCVTPHCGASIYATVGGTHYDDELLFPCYPILYPDNYPDDDE